MIKYAINKDWVEFYIQNGNHMSKIMSFLIKQGILACHTSSFELLQNNKNKLKIPITQKWYNGYPFGRVI